MKVYCRDSRQGEHEGLRRKKSPDMQFGLGRFFLCGWRESVDVADIKLVRNISAIGLTACVYETRRVREQPRRYGSLELLVLALRGDAPQFRRG